MSCMITASCRYSFTLGGFCSALNNLIISRAYILEIFHRCFCWLVFNCLCNLQPDSISTAVPHTVWWYLVYHSSRFLTHHPCVSSITWTFSIKFSWPFLNYILFTNLLPSSLWSLINWFQFILFPVTSGKSKLWLGYIVIEIQLWVVTQFTQSFWNSMCKSKIWGLLGYS